MYYDGLAQADASFGLDRVTATSSVALAATFRVQGAPCYDT